ncbi:serine hydrolase [Streptomyces sp. NPDC048441]|uniref:serine hydrolase n=1 Tax=Streptomyces sp. NPDC048441 TaxID=3365552 RepID=UPI0037201739
MSRRRSHDAGDAPDAPDTGNSPGGQARWRRAGARTLGCSGARVLGCSFRARERRRGSRHRGGRSERRRTPAAEVEPAGARRVPRTAAHRGAERGRRRRPVHRRGGATISDSGDLNRFYSALLGGKLLPARQLKEMKTTVPVSGAGLITGYGLGLMKFDLPCGSSLWGHGGNIQGSASQAVTTPDGKHSLAFNFNGDWAGNSQAVIEAEYCPGGGRVL